MSELTEWANFYVILGSAAAGLTGLQFVAMALLANLPADDNSTDASNAFATPNIIHFAAVLIISAAACAPWRSIITLTIFWTILGLAGAIYAIIVAWRMRTQKAYKPVFQDWLTHVLAPLFAYLLIIVAAICAQFYLHEALFILATALLKLLFVGIYNTWDSVVYIVTVRRRREHQHQGD